MTIEIISKYEAWPKETLTWAEEAEGALFEVLGYTNRYEVVCLLTDDDEMRRLNSEFRNKDQATNVLSWPSVDYQRDLHGAPTTSEEIDESLGDLALGYQTCVKEAEAIGLEQHFKHLVIHGILHLIGYDHVEDNHAEKMEALEIEALARLNIANPYKVAEI